MWHVLMSKMAVRYRDEISIRISSGETHETISIALQARNLSQRGLSARSVRRLCSEEGIHYRSRLNDRQLDQIITREVRNVGNAYGRRTMQGLLRAQGIHVSERRVGRSMGRVAPGPQHGRRQRARRHLNPPVYTARFFGDKLHLDQNEKLAMYGVTHVIAVDGFSRKIVGMITLPVKNAVAIYNTLFGPLLQSVGLWQQVRVDHGTEFALVLTVQQHLADHRLWQDRHPALQSTSRQNHRVERLWPEVNQRINYPVKRVLVQMEGDDEIDMSNDTIKFCVSWTTINVIETATKTFISSWNEHRIPGNRGGIPNVLASRSSQVAHLRVVPTTAEVIHLHCRQGRRLTDEHGFGRDPLEGHQSLQQLRERDFFQRFPSMELVFQDVLHHGGNLCKDAVQFFIHLTISFSELVTNI